MRVLITCPRLHLDGGVANYFNIIKNYLSVEADILEVGAVKKQEYLFQKSVNLFWDYLRFYGHLKSNRQKYDLIHLNPSLLHRSLIRDASLLRIANGFGKKNLVFFRGWNLNSMKIIDKYFLRVFLFFFNKADAFIVLASEFKDILRTWGFRQPIFVETTLVDDEILKDFCIEYRARRINCNRRIQLLFLARIEKEKGICEAIEAVKILSQVYPNLSLIVAGHGPFTNGAREFTNKIGIGDKVSFIGYVKGEAKKNIFQNSDIYVFPTYYGEGMPSSVLEAMAFGLPVVTRPVAGLKDFFLHGKYGFLTESKKPAAIASLVEKIILDRDLWREMSIAGHNFAKSRFLASKVAKRLQEIYADILSGKTTI